MDKILLNEFIKCAKENRLLNSGTLKCLLIKDNAEDLYGQLYVSNSAEELDNHCDQCAEEQPFFVKFAAFDNLPIRLVADIGPTKYQKILDGKIKLDNIEIICDLLEEQDNETT